MSECPNTQDPTPESLVQENLTPSQTELRLVWESALDGIRLTDGEGIVRRVNDAYCRLMGKPREELEGHPMCVPYLEARQAEILEKHQRRFRGRSIPPRLERDVVLWNGKSLRLELSNAFLTLPGQADCLLTVFHDVTGSRRAEQARDQSEALYRDLVETSQDLIWQCDAEGRYTYLNPAWEAVLGYRLDEMLGRPFTDFQSAEQAARDRGVFARLLAGETVTGHESVHRRKDGSAVCLVFNAKVVRDELGRVAGTRGTAYDITERRRTEAALQAECAFRNALLECATVGLCVCHEVPDYPYVSFTVWNPRMVEITGYSIQEVNQRGWYQTVYPDPETRARAIARMARMRTGDDLHGEEWEITRSDGTQRVVNISTSIVRKGASDVHVLAVMQDMTERKRAEEEKDRLQAQLTQAQKMESVGRLAGGVAHDFNNMLQAILGNAALALQDLAPNHPVREGLEEIQKSARRSADLTRQLLAFARKQTISPKVLDLNDTITGMLKMLQRLIGEDIQLAWWPSPTLWPVKMDPSQIDQVLANLTVNARHAIRGVGQITIETANVTLGEADPRAHGEGVPGDYVLLTVSDTGCGMDPLTKAHLFEPFFTTKGVGQGTGLGLAMVYGIVKQNGGWVHVESEPGQGTTFRIYLPRAEARAAALAVAAEEPSLRGTETVLVVEDEEQILLLAQRILRLHGYTVLAARTPKAALELVAGYSGPIHLLVTDVVMPGMNGRELWTQTTVLKPGLRCLFMSGYTANVIAHQGVLEDDLPFLQKPFTIEALTRQVRQILERGQV